MGEFVFLAVCVSLAACVVRSVLRGRPLVDAVTAIAVAIYVLCMWIPAHLQNAGLVDSKIFEASLMAPPDAAEISSLCWRWSLELLVLHIAQRLPWFNFRACSGSGKSFEDKSLFRPEALSVILLVVGALSALVFQVDLDDRAAGGHGVQTLLKTCMLCALAIMTFYRFFGRRRYKIMVFTGILFLVVMGVRSPLFVVFFAYLTSELLRNRFRSTRRVLLVGVVAGALAFIGSAMSAVRGNLIRNTGVSPADALEDTLAAPWLAPFEAGLDTLDGYRVSALIESHLPPQYGDLLNIFTTFIPRAIWPGKPTDLVVEIGTNYLGYQGSGQYLSPIGYLSIVFDGYGFAVAALAVFAFFASLLLRVLSPGFWCAVVLCVVFRFFLGGSSFDIYYGLTLAVPILVVQSLLWVVQPLRFSHAGPILRGRQGCGSSLLISKLTGTAPQGASSKAVVLSSRHMRAS